MRTIALLGGTGFVGKHFTHLLIKKGWNVKILTRQRERHRHLLVLPKVELISADVYQQEQLNTHLEGCEVVVNLVGILNETENDGSGFRRAHVELPQKIVTACQVNQIQRLLHLSALNAHPHREVGKSHYLCTKGEGEDFLHSTQEVLHVTTFKPSAIFGEGDSFLNRFASLLRVPSPIFMLPSGKARLSPVWVEDVVEVMFKALDNPKYYGQRYHLCGPKIYTLRELVEHLAKVMEVKRLVIPLDDKLSYFTARVMELVPGRPYSRDNYHSFTLDSVCTDNHFAHFGMAPHTLEEIVPRYFGPFSAKATRYSQYRSHARR